MATAYEPEVALELALGYAGALSSPPASAWVDVSQYAWVANPVRGRSSELDEVTPGSLVAELEGEPDDPRRFDPLNTAGPYYGDLVVGTPLRLLADLPSAGQVFADTFAADLDFSRWYLEGPQAGAVVSAGALSLTEQLGAAVRVRSQRRYAFEAGATFLVEMTECQTSAGASLGLTSGRYASDTSASVLIFQCDGTTLVAALQDSAGNLDGAAVAYNATAHRWLRIRRTATNLIWDTASAASATFTTLFSSATSAFPLLSFSLRPALAQLVTTSAGRRSSFGSVELTCTRFPLYYGTADAFTHKPTSRLSRTRVPTSDAMKQLARIRLPLSVYETEVLADNPILYWRLDEEDGDLAADLTSAGRAGRYVATGLVRGGESIVPYGSSKSTQLTRLPPGPCIRGDSDAYLWTHFAGTTLNCEFWCQSAPLTDSIDYYLIIQGNDPGSATSAERFALDYVPNGSLSTLRFFHNEAANKQTNFQVPRLDDGQPHHVRFGIYGDTSVGCFVDGVNMPSVLTSTTPAPADVPRGFYVGGYGAAYPSWPGLIAHVALFNNISPGVPFSHYDPEPWVGDLPGARIHRILDLIGWPLDRRDIELGEVPLGPASLAGAAVLDYLQRVNKTEQGRLFLGVDNAVIFHGNDRTIDGTPAYTFTDDPGADAGIVDEGAFTLSLDDRFFFEQATVTREGGAPQRALAAGVTVPTTGYDLDGIMATTDVSSRNIANRIVQRYGVATTRVDDFQIQPEEDPDSWAALLSLELGDVVAVELTPAGEGDPIELELFIERLGHDVETDDWLMNVYGSPTDQTAYFQWGGPAGTGWGEGQWR